MNLDWQDEALCKPIDAALYTADSKPREPQLQRLTTICGACSVQFQCASTALESGTPGVWAGVYLYPNGPQRSAAIRVLRRKAGRAA